MGEASWSFTKFLRGVTVRVHRQQVKYPGLDRSVTGDTLDAVKTISIKELHAETGRWVRTAKKRTLIVTDRGEQVASLQPLSISTKPRAVLNAAERRAWMPVTPFDSTVFISEDRDGR